MLATLSGLYPAVAHMEHPPHDPDSYVAVKKNKTKAALVLLEDIADQAVDREDHKRFLRGVLTELCRVWATLGV